MQTPVPSPASAGKSALLHRLLGIGSAALLTLFCFNIFNPLPAIFETIAIILQPIGMMMPGSIAFLPLLLVLLLLNIALARLITTYSRPKSRAFARTFWRSSLVFMPAAFLYIGTVLWALSRMDG